MIDYSNLSEKEKIDLFDLRVQENSISEYNFQIEEKPGILKYKKIKLGKKYVIKSDNKKKYSGRVLEVLSFIYKREEGGTDALYNNSVPMGVSVRFLDRNVKGSYYDVLDLVELN